MLYQWRNVDNFFIFAKGGMSHNISFATYSLGKESRRGYSYVGRALLAPWVRPAINRMNLKSPWSG